LKTTDTRQLEEIGAIFRAVAGRLSEQQASDVTANAVDAILKTIDTGRLMAMGTILQAVAGRLSEQQVSAVAAKFVDAILKTTDTRQLKEIRAILQAVAGRLSEQQASAVAAKLVDAILKTTDTDQLMAMGTILRAAAARLSEQQASAAAGKLVDAILKASIRNLGPFEDHAMGLFRPFEYNAMEIFEAVAPRLPWNVRMPHLISLMKHPFINREWRTGWIIEALKQHPEATKIQAPGDMWAAVEWLEKHLRVDVDALPERPKS